MSYILDALKKSEAEQDPSAAANLAANLELNQQRNQTRQRLTGVLVVAALLANVAVLLWLFGPTQLTPSVAGVAAPPTPAVSPPVSAHESPAVQAAPVTPARKSTESVQEPAMTAAARQPAQSSPPAARRPIKARLADLPASIRGRFPGLAFSTHIYAEDPSLRAVVANGSRLVEGDEIGGAAVQRITDDGVIMAFENYLIEIPIVADWE